MAERGAVLGFSNRKKPQRGVLLGDGSYVENRPSRWELVKQALWDSNLNTPVRGFYNLMNTPAETLLYDKGAAGSEAVSSAFDAAGGMMLGGSVVPKPRNSLNMGIKAYHGSPHSFDKFSMDKIGTGEGAQAYGHGLYFAEDEAIAKSYRDTLKHKGAIDIEGEGYRLGLPLSRNAQIELRRQAAVEKNDPMKAAFWLQAASAETRAMPQEKLAELIDRYRSSKTGKMYEVNINADPDQFLDWDKPLSKQPETARTALDAELRRYLGPSYERQKPNFGSRSAGEILGETNRDIVRQAEILREAGIPGIKYLDAGSRGAGDGSRNYVVFDDKLISIVRKYGIAGASALLGYSVLNGANEAQADELRRIDSERTR
jgi:hypothetical protein